MNRTNKPQSGEPEEWRERAYEQLPSGITFADERRSVHDLEITTNAYGRDIYVEEWDEYTGKPKIWYESNKQEILVKSVRGPSGISTTCLGKSPYID